MKLIVEVRDGNQTTSTTPIEVSGQDLVGFHTGVAQPHLQIAKFVIDTYGDWRGMAFGMDGGLVSYWYDANRTVVVRLATLAEVRAASFKRLPRVLLPFQIAVPARILREAEADAVMLLRLGAAANALQTVLTATERRQGVAEFVRKRDLIHNALIVASYVKEVQHIVHGDKSDKGRLWELARLGVQQGRQLPWETSPSASACLIPTGRFLIAYATCGIF